MVVERRPVRAACQDHGTGPVWDWILGGLRGWECGEGVVGVGVQRGEYAEANAGAAAVSRPDNGQRTMTAAERRRAVEEAEELLAEDLRLHLTLEEEVGLALRAVRGAQGMSQRVYAEAHDWSASQQARVETRAGGLRFGHVLAMLAPIEVTLCVLGDLGRVRSKKVTADVMGGTSADPGRGVDGQVVPLATPADLSAWIIARSRELGVGTRVVADLADTSQTMVCRGRSGTRIENVRLDVLERIVGALDGSMRIAWDDSGAPELIEPWDWPTAALVPRARGGERRLRRTAGSDARPMARPGGATSSAPRCVSGGNVPGGPGRTTAGGLGPPRARSPRFDRRHSCSAASPRRSSRGGLGSAAAAG